jgi:hypothetical protein
MQPWIGEPPAHCCAEPPDGAEPDQLGKSARRGQQAERGVVVPVDEVRHLDEVEPAQPVDELVECGRVNTAARLGDLLPHRLPAVAHVDRAAVGKAGPVRRIEPPHREQFAQLGARINGRGTDGVSDQVRHSQYCRPGIEGESIAVEYARPTARQLLSLHHSDVVPAAYEIAHSR